MLNQHRGFPLARPSLSDTLPVAYLRRGVSTGDVGFMFDDGEFDFLFNIYLPAYHPVNDGERNVPEDFTPMDEPEIVQHDYPPGSYVANGFERTNTASPEFSDALSFRSLSMFGAICGLPCGSKVEKLTDLDEMRQYAVSHAASWYDYARKRNRPRVNGSLYLVTGTEKSDSWAITVTRQLCYGGSCMHLMNSKVHDESFPRYWVHSPSHTADFTNQPNDVDVHGRQNQTLFLHGFKIGLGASEWTAVTDRYGYKLIYDPHNRRTSWIARLFSWMPNWFVAVLWRWPSWFANTYFVPFHDTQTFHPSIILTEYLLGRVPDASSVVVHDDDWAALVRDVSRCVPPDESASLTLHLRQ
ncbi:hypothetical protein C8R47DRAFT_1146799 [Mycena vitilis]|nr:hypothetical protein C8R47DRAFT_1146799 [Mycena vitilis]